MAKKSKRIDDPMLRELDAIKRLLIVHLYRSGVSQGDVAKALKIDAGDLSRMVPARALTTSKATPKRQAKPTVGTDDA